MVSANELCIKVFLALSYNQIPDRYSFGGHSGEGSVSVSGFAPQAIASTEAARAEKYIKNRFMKSLLDFIMSPYLKRNYPVKTTLPHNNNILLESQAQRRTNCRKFNKKNS